MRRMDEVSWPRRSEIRHILQHFPSDIAQLRNDILPEKGYLNLDGAIEEIDHWITELRYVRSILDGKREEMRYSIHARITVYFPGESGAGWEDTREVTVFEVSGVRTQEEAEEKARDVLKSANLNLRDEDIEITSVRVVR